MYRAMRSSLGRGVVPRGAHDPPLRPARPADPLPVESVLLDFGSYPRSVFGFVAQWAMTWILPVAFTAWVTAPSTLSACSVSH
jgi:hypothetical protein